MTRLPQSEIKARLAYRAIHGTEDGFVPAPRKRRANEEYQIQSAFMRWWKENCSKYGVAECLLFAIPNGSVLGSFKKDRQIRGTMLKAAGLRNGVCDTMLCVPAGRYHGLFMEFKKPGGVLSDNQETFIGFALSRGYRCEVVDSVEGAIKVVEGYLPNQ